MLSGKYRLLERDAAKTAIDLNLAAAELKSLTEQVAEREQAHERAPAGLLRAGGAADGRAAATSE